MNSHSGGAVAPSHVADQPTMSRRRLLAAASVAAGGLLAGCATQRPPHGGPHGGPQGSSAPVGPQSDAVRKYAEKQRSTGAATHRVELAANVGTIDLGGPTVTTWTFSDQLPGRLIRGTAGDLVKVRVSNHLPQPTSVHWHGLAVPNDMDGVPGVTQEGIAAGRDLQYEFVLPDPGTYWYHSHAGLQLDRGLYGPLIIDDPHEPGRYDDEWILVLDDWLDGTGRTPDRVLSGLKSMGGGPPSPSSGGMSGMPMPGDSPTAAGSSSSMGGMSGMPMPGASVSASGQMPGMAEMTSTALGGDAGDVSYPHYLLNGRVPTAPQSFRAKPGDKVRLRIINAGADTTFRVALGGHRLRVTHTDGFPVKPVTVETLLIGMGERYDVEVTLDDGVFPLVAAAEGKNALARAIVRTGSGTLPKASARPTELTGRLLAYDDLRPDGHTLASKNPDRRHDLVLGGQMMPYQWTINGKTFTDREPLPVRQGEYVRLRYRNTTTMYHPMHLHGHTFALRGSGIRKDTMIVFPHQQIEVDFRADNPGQWVTHCHNDYHMQAGMMTVVSYHA